MKVAKFIDVFPWGVVRVNEMEFKCALGSSGVVHQKKEGDLATPIGSFPLRSVMYRSDRESTPKTSLKTRRIKDTDIWCNDPLDINYNRLLSSPHPSSHENLWRADPLYDILIEIGYNDSPPIPNSGSAIFIHLAQSGYKATKGCVALRHSDLLKLLRVCGPETLLRIKSSDY